MGKSQKPLHIVVAHDLWDWEEIKALESQGHRISSLVEDEPDVILGPQCWMMDEEHRQYLDLAIAEARKVRYPKVDKETKDEE